MKHYSKFTIALFFFALFLMLSCQSEENSTAENPDVLTKDSPLTGLISRVVLNDTSYDNVMDSTSCFAVKLPVQVLVNQTQMTINTPNDLAAVASILTASALDDDSVNFTYPITVVYQDYTETVVEDDAALNISRMHCDFQPPQEHIGCVAINYPISISSYDPDFQIIDNHTISSDRDLFLFTVGLNGNEFYEIDFPISITNNAGDVESIDSALGLMDAINTGIQACACDNPEILIDDLVLYLPFANEANDLTTFGSPVIFGQTHYVTDRSGNQNGALSFDEGNTGNKISIAGNVNNNMMANNKFTISLWFNRQNTDPTTAFEQLFTVSDLSIRLGNQLNNQVRSPNVLVALPDPVYDLDWVNTGMTAELDAWHHLVVTWDGDLLLLYRDGALRNAATSLAFNSFLAGGELGINYKGYLDDIRIYKRVLSQQQVQTLYNLPGDVNTCLN